MRVAVLGCGYVGLVSAVGLAAAGHTVAAVDADPARRAAVAGGDPPFREPGLRESMRQALNAGRLEVAGDLAAAAAEADVVLICVQTPPGPDGAADLSFVDAAATGLAEALRARRRPAVDRPVVAVRSTVVPGTADRLQDGPLRGLAGVASNPEFLREGRAVDDFAQPDRIVVGAPPGWMRERMAALYAPLGGAMVFMPRRAAEMAKYAANALWATLVSFSNELARVCERVPGTDIEAVLEAVRLDRRLTPRLADTAVEPEVLGYLRAGCGFGGSCLPKDVAALAAFARACGEEPALLEAVTRVNRSQPARVVAMAEEALGGLAGRRVAVLGLAFKAGTDDVRTSPGIEMALLAAKSGARVAVFDPLVGPDRLDWPTDRVWFAPGLEEAVLWSEACIVATAEPAFAARLGRLAASRRGPVLIDGRRLLPAGRLGARHRAVGRSAAQAEPPSGGRVAAAQVAPPSGGRVAAAQVAPPSGGRVAAAQAAPPSGGRVAAAQAAPPSDGAVAVAPRRGPGRHRAAARR